MTDTITTQQHKCTAEQRPRWSCRVFADRGPVSERCRGVGAKGRPGPPRQSGSSSSPARSAGRCLPQAQRPAGRRSGCLVCSNRNWCAPLSNGNLHCFAWCVSGFVHNLGWSSFFSLIVLVWLTP
jgi:hypothetical protein